MPRLAIDSCRREGRHAEPLALVEVIWFLADLLRRFDTVAVMVKAAHAAAIALGDIPSRAFAPRQQAWVQRGLRVGRATTVSVT